MTRLMQRNLFLLATLLGLLLGLEGPTLALSAEEADPFAPYDDGTPDGYMIIEGDVLVPIDYFERRQDGMVPFGTFAPGPWLFEVMPWPGGVVRYEFDGNVSAMNRTLMRNAMDDLEAATNVQFILDNDADDYLHIQNATVNNSAVGREGGEQIVNIFNWGTNFIMVHELMHALGFWHEQTRPDRNTFVTIEWDRIPEDKEHNFERHDEADVYGWYDFDSVMHYGQYAFSTCSDAPADPINCRTITVKPPWNTQWQSEIGQKNHLSYLDIVTLQALYPESSTVFVDQAYQGTIEVGTFWWPYKEFTAGAAFVPVGGTVSIRPGNYAAVGVYSKAMTLEGPLGGVVLGN